jgi:glycosyltransferase involved in cell wall biosynthesis
MSTEKYSGSGRTFSRPAIVAPVAPVSVTIITKNESSHIEACIASVSWADEVLVVDSGSADDTVARAERAGARVVSREWPGYAAQKNWAAEHVTHDWVLSIDADERVTPELRAEIGSALAAPGETAGYRIPRLTWHLGRWWRHTDWYPDYQLRLYDRRRGQWKPKIVHESVTVAGPVAALTCDLQHFAYRDVSHHAQTISKYSRLAAEEMFAQGKRAGLVRLIVHPLAAFFRNYVLKGGILEGGPGLVVSAMNAQYVFLKFATLWLMSHPKIMVRMMMVRD